MDLDKEPSIYMRFHITLEKAISFCKNLYGNKMVPGTNVPHFNQALTIAGLTQDIDQQDYLDYHLTWLTGVLSDTKHQNQETFQNQIDNILRELQDIQRNRVKQYVRLVTYNPKLPRGQQYKDMLERVKEMDSIACYIMIFKLYETCDSINEKRNIVSFEEMEAFFAYAYLFWWSSIYRHGAIGKNIKGYIRQFFKTLEKQLGSIGEARKKATKLYELK